MRKWLPVKFHNVPRVDDTLLRRTMFFRPATGSGHFPSLCFAAGGDSCSPTTGRRGR
jgi:hypothetical protein